MPVVDTKPAATALLAKFPRQRARIERGLAQVQALWRAEDGDSAALTAFAEQHFLGDEGALDLTFHRLERALEAVDGHLLEIGRELRAPSELELPALSPPTAVDEVLAGWDASAHVVDDWFANKLAFAVLLNFPQSTLAERLKTAERLSRRDWAVARLTGRFSRRVPGEIAAKQAAVAAAADRYIADYNLWMHHVLDARGQRVFPRDMKLISHWNLRDELKSQYSQGTEGTNRQRTIVKLMERIVTQTIPDVVINSPWIDYDPFTNVARVAPLETAERKAPAGSTVVGQDEILRPTNRYRLLLDQFRASAAADAYTPMTPSAIQRSFELYRELPEERVERLLLDVLQSPLVAKVAAEIERRLGRKLEPQDLWYDGFKARSSIPPDELDEKIRARYPTADAYRADMPRMFRELGFSREKSEWLATHIVVEPSRGAGHALQASRRGDVPHLRTRVGDKGMDYKGYNIAVHEMGHNVEQLFSLYDVDSTLLQGVPNSAFTEAVAFVFQARDLELLGLSSLSTEAKRESVLADFWATWEIAGVALVDVAVWHWMYEHPEATPAELRDATVAIASDLWKKHYAKILGGIGVDGQATPLLGIYSHMVAYPLYLADYPLGHMIAFRIEEQIDRATSSGKTTLGEEIERMCKVGAVAPDVWMKNAAGQPVSAAPLLRATRDALAALRATPSRHD